MINNWQVPRNKRKLYPVVDILSLFTLQNLGDVWNHDLTRQLNFEAELERYGLKRPGPRRDRRGGGARTYESWLFNLGLIFTETNSGILRTTLAGEALLAGNPPVDIITNQLMKLQYPSPYSIRSGVRINSRFQIRPFRFLLRLLTDSRIQTLSKEEIGRFVITEGENETIQCFEHVVNRIIRYRLLGDIILSQDFEILYQSSKNGVRSRSATLAYLEDIANTIINYLEYTQLIARDHAGRIYIPQEKQINVMAILNDGTSLRLLHEEHEFGIENFQRNFGLVFGQNRDNRTFGGQAITDTLYRERRVRSELLHIAGIRPIISISMAVIQEIANSLGYTELQVESALEGFRPDTFSVFEAGYLNMAISGTELAKEFEIATQNIFQQLGFISEHVGNNPLHPDVFVESSSGYSGIIDNKAYRAYSINNDHRNRMINNYIPLYKDKHDNLEFFMYIADGFGSNIDNQLLQISQRTQVNGCVITARNLIRLLQKHLVNPIEQSVLRDVFKCNSSITIHDIDAI